MRRFFNTENAECTQSFVEEGYLPQRTQSAQSWTKSTIHKISLFVPLCVLCDLYSVYLVSLCETAALSALKILAAPCLTLRANLGTMDGRIAHAHGAGYIFGNV